MSPAEFPMKSNEIILLHYLADEVNTISPNNVLVILDTYNQDVFVF